MIVTVTANAAIDRTLHVARLEPGTLHRPQSEHAQAGGKGINVARALRALGHRVQTVVVVGGESGQWILRDLELAGLRCSVVHAPGESRTCLEIVDAGARATQIHGAGVDGSGNVAAHLVACVAEAARGAHWVALCGSLPIGMPGEAARWIVEAAHAAGARVAVDTSGAALREALAAGPDLVRVNRAEAEQADLALRGAGARVISDGPRAVLAYAGSGRVIRVAPPSVEARNSVGCGDAMMAGLLATLEEGASFADALRRGTALASAQAAAAWAGAADAARARQLMATLELEEIPD